MVENVVMRSWERVRAAPWLTATLGLILAGVLLFIGGLTTVLMSGTGEKLQQAGERSEVLGVALTVAGLAGATGLRILRRLRGERVQVSPDEGLRRQVATRENEIRLALLAGLTPANLAYGPYGLALG